MNVASFREYLLENGIGDETSAQYLGKLRCLENSHALDSPDKFRQFLLKKHDMGDLVVTVNSYIKLVRIYGDFIKNEWMKNYKYWKKQKDEYHEKEILNDEEILNIIHCPCPEFSDPVRWHMWDIFFEIAAFSGMRGSNVARLKPDDIDFGSNNFILGKTKTTPVRVPIAPNIIDDLKEYLQTCGEYLFPSLNESKYPHIWSKAWIDNYTIRAKLCGIKRKTSLHCLRHSLITNLLENGASIVDVMKIANHTSINTTLGYTHLLNKSQQNALRKHSIIRGSIPLGEQLAKIVKDIEESGFLEQKGVSSTVVHGKKLIIEIVD